MTEQSKVLLIDVAGGHAERLSREISRRGLTPVSLNLGAVREALLTVELPELQFVMGDQSNAVRLDELRSVWISSRYPNSKPLSRKRDERSFVQDEWHAALENLFLLTRHLPWVNPLDTDFAADSKLYQLQVARRIGFRIPRTVTTNDPERFVSFLKGSPSGVAVKRLCNFPVFIRTSMKRKMVYTNLIRKTDLARLSPEMIRNAPCFFQEYVPKQSEFRVFVVGSNVFPVEIFSQNEKQTETDWRHYPLKKNGEMDYSRWKCSVGRLPAVVEKQCWQMAQMLGFPFTGIDLIKRPDGEFVFLEANSPAAWGWVETPTGLPITEAIVDLLEEIKPARPRTMSL